MSTISSGDEIAVFKFESTGIVPLCQEVVALVEEGWLQARGADLSSGSYRLDKNGHNIVFKVARDHV